MALCMIQMGIIVMTSQLQLKIFSLREKKKNSVMLWGLSRAIRGLLTLLKCRKNVGLQLPENSLAELGIRQHSLLLRLLAVGRKHSPLHGFLKDVLGYLFPQRCVHHYNIYTYFTGETVYFNISVPSSVHLLLSRLGSLQNEK